MGCECDRRMDSMQAQIDSLRVNAEGGRDESGRVTSPGFAQRVRGMEKRFDTGDSPAWKRLLFRIDGWGPWFQLRPKPRWRPWRRWWTS